MKILSVVLMITWAVTFTEGQAEVKLDDINRPATLICPLPFSMDPVWSHNGSDIKNSSRYKLDPQNNSLTIISVTSENDLGDYTCTISGYKEKVTLKSRPIMSKPAKKSLSLVEGYTLSLECTGYGYPSPTGGLWMKDGSIPVPDDYDARVSKDFTISGLWGTEKLSIKSVKTSDQGEYMCIIVNSVGQRNVSAYVRVNSKYAPLWPFIGIVLQVVVLVIIIAVVTKRKARVDNKEN